LQQSLVLGDGPPRWRLNLAALESAMPALAGFPDFPAGASYSGPALFIAGGRSDALAPAHEAATTALFPHAAVARVADAGHWVHAERPEALLALIEPFLTRGIPRDAD
jgi:pimeloyl-ACP methyl ester carboxylesterase